jgi:hypothetical protein
MSVDNIHWKLPPEVTPEIRWIYWPERFRKHIMSLKED